MKEIDNKEVQITYILRGKSKSASDFLEKRRKLLEKKKIRKPLIVYYNTWNDFFLKETTWYEATINPQKTKIVNNIFHSLCMTFGRLGVSFEEIVEEYKNRNLPKRDLKKIDEIRKTLSINPRVIMISNTKEHLSIFDGWHTSIAFYVENKDIPAYIGIGKDFNCLRIK